MMSTPRLVWSCLWRSGLSGLGLGFFLGSMYGMLVMPVAMTVEDILTTGKPQMIHDPVGGGALMIAAAIGWAVGGFSMGAPAGLVAGLINGLLITLLLGEQYYPTSDAHRYRKLARRVCGVGTVVVVLLLYAFFGFFDHSSDAEYVLTSLTNNYLINLSLIVIVPTLAAGVVSGWAGGRLATWYLPRIS